MVVIVDLRKKIAGIIFEDKIKSAGSPDAYVYSDETASKILKLLEQRIDKMIEVAYERDPVSVWALTQVKEMLR